MKNYGISFSAITIAAVCAVAPAHAMLVLQSEQSFQGTGLGAANTILTLQSPGNSTTETGSVGRMMGNPNDVITGDAMTGGSQTQTRSLSSLGLTSASDLRVVFNALEPGGGANSITLSNLQLNIYSPTGSLLFNSGTFAPVVLQNTQTGAGNSGFVFALDATQAAQAQASAFTGNFGGNLVGLSATANNATGGFETFFVTSIPEPETYGLMLAGLAAVAGVVRRRKAG